MKIEIDAPDFDGFKPTGEMMQAKYGEWIPMSHARTAGLAIDALLETERKKVVEAERRNSLTQDDILFILAEYDIVPPKKFPSARDLMKEVARGFLSGVLPDAILKAEREKVAEQHGSVYRRMIEDDAVELANLKAEIKQLREALIWIGGDHDDESWCLETIVDRANKVLTTIEN